MSCNAETYSLQARIHIEETVIPNQVLIGEKLEEMVQIEEKSTETLMVSVEYLYKQNCAILIMLSKLFEVNSIKVPDVSQNYIKQAQKTVL